MSLIHQYDIRLESYSDTDDVTLLNDQVGTADLTDIATLTKVTYNAANDWMVFTTADDTIGDATMPASLETVFQSDNWCIAVLIEQSALLGDFLLGIGNSADASAGIGIRTDTSGNAVIFLRGVDTTTNSATTSGGIDVDSPRVVIIRRDSTTGYVSVDAGTEASVTITTNLDVTDWNRIALGLLPRSSYANQWTGGTAQELRIYDSNESGNLSSIVSSMKSGVTVPVLSSPLGSSTGQTTAQCEVTTDTDNGTLYGIISTSATQPSIVQIQAGQDHTGSAAVWSDNQAVTTTGNQVMSATGLTAATVYFCHTQQEDAATNDSVVITAPQFTTDALPTPDITDVTTPVITGGNVILTGTEFESTQGTGDIDQEGTSLTESAWSDISATAATLTIESTVLKYGNNTLTLTNDSGNSDSVMFEATPVSGNDYVDLSTLATSGNRITALPGLASGDQLRYEDILFQGATPTVFTVTVAVDGTFIIGNGPAPDGTYEFQVRAWDNGTPGWGTAVDQTVVISSEDGPLLTSPIGVSAGQASATGTVTSDTTGGTIWAYLSQSATPPSIIDHKAGTGADDTDTENSPVSGLNSFSFSGLSSETVYYVHYLQNDDTTDSAQVTSAQFTTDAPPTPPSGDGRITVRDQIIDQILDQIKDSVR